LLDRAGLRSLRAEIAETVRHFGNRAGLIGCGVDAIDGVENLRPQGLGHNPPLDNHHSGGTVDLRKPEEPVAGSSKGSVHIAD
jgi:hypothetical protein